MSEKWLIFDLETTGLWKPELDPFDDEQPDIVQIGAVMTSDELHVMNSISFILNSERPSDPEALRTHQIFDRQREEVGIRPVDGLLMLLELMSMCTRLAAFNLEFDMAVLKCAIRRYIPTFFLVDSHPLERISKHCVMRALTPYMELEWPDCEKGEKAREKYGPFKFPSLATAYKALVDPDGRDEETEHDALGDAMATLAVMDHGWRCVDFTGPDSLLREQEALTTENTEGTEEKQKALTTKNTKGTKEMSERECFNCAIFDHMVNRCFADKFRHILIDSDDHPMPCGGDEWESDSELNEACEGLFEALENPPWCKTCHVDLTWLAMTTGGWHCSRCGRTFYAKDDMGHGDPSSASGQERPTTKNTKDTKESK